MNPTIRTITSDGTGTVQMSFAKGDVFTRHCLNPAFVLAKASYTPSPEAREKIKKNCDGCQRSRESKISFRGPLPINRAGNALAADPEDSAVGFEPLAECDYCDTH